MAQTLAFPDLLRLIEERSTAFVAAVAAAPRLDVPVPTCPEWTLADLVAHLGQGRRDWAATIAAGPDAAAKAVPTDTPAMPSQRQALLAWLAAATQELLAALREAGPDRSCWTWWSTSQSPQTCGAVARHQLQEIAVHTYDVHVTLGAAQPVPPEVALDGVEEFLFTCCATTTPWPHQPATMDFHAIEGRSWRLRLSADGARACRLPTPRARPTGATGDTTDTPGTVDASARGTAGDLVLVFYGRIAVDSLDLTGDRQLFDQLAAWDPDA